MHDQLYSLLEPSLAKRPKVASHKLLDMLHQEHKDRFAKDLRRTVPLLDDRLDKACLNHERVGARELSGAGSASSSSMKTGKKRHSPASTLKHFINIDDLSFSFT